MSPIYVGVGTADSEARNLTLGLPLLTSDPSSPESGDMYFNTSDYNVKYYDGSAWVAAESSGGGGGSNLTSMSIVAQTSGGDGSTAQVTAPAGIQAGDLLIIMEYGPDVTSNLYTGNIPSGFTKICDAENAAVDQRLHYKIAAGSESGTTYTGQTGSNENMWIGVFRGNVPITSVAVVTSWGNKDTTGPSISMQGGTQAGKQFIVCANGSRYASTCTLSPSAPSSGWTTYNNIESSGSNECEAVSWNFQANAWNGTVSASGSYGSTSRNTACGCILDLNGDYSGNTGAPATYDYQFDKEVHYGNGSAGDGGSQNFHYDNDGTMPDINLGSNISNFDMYFECYYSTADQNAQSNDWVICTDGYSDTNGWLLGFYNNNVTNEMSIAHPNGAYGIYPNYGLPPNQWNWVKIEWRGGSSFKVWQKTSASATFINRVNTTSNVYNGTDWNFLSIGQGRGSNSGHGSNGNFSSQFYGKIKNFRLNVNSNVTNL